MKNTINKYFEVKVKLQKTMDDGVQKKVSEQYVVEAATWMQTSSSRPRCHSLPWMKPLVKKRRPLSCIWYSLIR